MRCMRTLSFALFMLCAIVTNAQQFPTTFTNLQVLPKDISPSDLMQTMRSFSFALGVRCSHCHAESAPKKFDYAADDKQEKKTARIMLTMVATINRDYVGKIGKPASVRVQCATCHHGITQPQPLNMLLSDTLEKKGVQPAIAQYRELRAKYYGSGAYDFGETPLNLIAESLMNQKKYPEAVAIMELSFAENHPDSIWSYHLLAMSHKANGELDKAKEDYRKVLKAHPDDTWAQSELDAMDRPAKPQ